MATLFVKCFCDADRHRDPCCDDFLAYLIKGRGFIVNVTQQIRPYERLKMAHPAIIALGADNA